jgi:hypothetical protein
MSQEDTCLGGLEEVFTTNAPNAKCIIIQIERLVLIQNIEGCIPNGGILTTSVLNNACIIFGMRNRS